MYCNLSSDDALKMHYVNKTIQNIALFKIVKIDNFSDDKMCYFLIFDRNIDCGEVLKIIHNLCLREKIRKTSTPVIRTFPI